MIIDCFRFVSGNISYFIIELSIVTLHIFIMIRFMKKNRKFFLQRFFFTAVFCIILDIIYRIYDFDLSHCTNIFAKFFYFIFSFFGAYAFFIISSISLLYTVASLVTYIVLTVCKGGER